MVDFLVKNGVGNFKYIAFHAPSRFSAHEEVNIVALLWNLLRDLPDNVTIHIVVHPDTLHDYDLWRSFGDKLCVENMDDRKPIGRTADELSAVFEKLPKARLCFDIGHAHEIDRSMSVGYEILRRFRNRISHVHASEVNDDWKHRAFSASSHAAFLKLAGLIPEEAPVILETDVAEGRVAAQLSEARCIFQVRGSLNKFV
jgi:hypothetical protein